MTRPDAPAITPVVTDADWQAVVAIRTAVFIVEQRCPPEEEWDAYDAPEVRGRQAHHLLARVRAVPAGTARWYVRQDAEDAAGLVWMGRFAVLPPYRGRGVGRALVAQALADARTAGYSRFALHAQAHLAAFYAAFGFVAEGTPFDEVGIPHVKMALTDP
ncbi:MAG: GNAT family N-acetyltransferase [Rubricoccaceae bacterium]